MDLTIEKIQTDKDLIQHNNNAHIIPAHPFRLIIVGSSGSGKTNLIANLLTRDCFYKDYFDIITVFSPNVKLDKIWRVVKAHQTFDNLANFNSDITEIITKQRLTVERKGIRRSPRHLIIVDDFADDRAVCKNPRLIEIFIKGRHYNISCMLGSQKYRAIDRTIRLNASDIIMFQPDNESELKQLAEENAKGVTKKRFAEYVEACTAQPYNFIHIQPSKPLAQRYKRNFSEYIKG